MFRVAFKAGLFWLQVGVVSCYASVGAVGEFVG